MSKREPRIKDFFETEIQLWCQAITDYPGEIHGGIVHGIIKEFGYVIRGSIKHAYAFDILEISEALSAAAKYLVPKKEICFSILGQFLPPYMLEEDQIEAMTKIVEEVEAEFGGAHDRLEKRWMKEYEINNKKNEQKTKNQTETKVEANATNTNKAPIDFDSLPLE